MFKVIFGIVAIFLLLLYLFTRSQVKKDKKKAEQEGAIEFLSANHIEGLEPLTFFEKDCDIYLFEDKLLIDTSVKKFEIPFTQIKAAEYLSEQEIKEKNKSVIGRAGIGTKKVKGKTNHYLIISYIGSDGELKGITFLNNFNVTRMSLFVMKINNKVRALQPDTIVL